MQNTIYHIKLILTCCTGGAGVGTGEAAASVVCVDPVFVCTVVDAVDVVDPALQIYTLIEEFAINKNFLQSIMSFPK